MTIKQISVLAVFAAMTLGIYLVVSPLYLFAFVLVVLSLHAREAYLYALVIALLTWVISGRIETLANLVWLPGMVWLLKATEVFIYDGKLADGCLSNPGRHHHVRLACMTFIAILLANLGSEFISMVIQELGLESILISSPIWIGGALINAILIGLFGIHTQRRISKLFGKLSG